MTQDNRRYDIIAYQAPSITLHHCNEFYVDNNGVLKKCDGQCPDHGMPYDDAIDYLIAWHQGHIKRLRAKKTSNTRRKKTTAEDTQPVRRRRRTRNLISVSPKNPK